MYCGSDHFLVFRRVKADRITGSGIVLGAQLTAKNCTGTGTSVRRNSLFVLRPFSIVASAELCVRIIFVMNQF